MGYAIQSIGSNWLDHTPSYSGFSVDPSGGAKRYVLIGKMCTYYHTPTSAGTSNAAATTVTLPFAAANTVAQSFECTLVNAGSVQAGIIRTRVNSNIADLLTSAAANPSASGAKSANFSITYEIA